MLLMVKDASSLLYRELCRHAHDLRPSISTAVSILYPGVRGDLVTKSFEMGMRCRETSDIIILHAVLPGLRIYPYSTDFEV